jgi:hypothetical protein
MSVISVSVCLLMCFTGHAGAAQAGTLLWTYDVGTPITSSPALALDGSVLIATSEALYAITNNGTFASNKWAFATEQIRQRSCGCLQLIALPISPRIISSMAMRRQMLLGSFSFTPRTRQVTQTAPQYFKLAQELTNSL